MINISNLNFNKKVYNYKNINLIDDKGIKSIDNNNKVKDFSINLLSTRYDFINDLYKDDTFHLKTIKGYFLVKNVYNLFTKDSLHKYFKSILYPHRYISDMPIKTMLKDMKRNNKYIYQVYMDDPKFSNCSYIHNMGLHYEIFLKGFKDVNLSLLKRIELFEKFLFKYMEISVFDNYNNTVLIPLDDWVKSQDDISYKKSINLISLFYFYIRKNIYKPELENFKNVVIYSKNGIARLDLNEIIKNKDRLLFEKIIKKLIDNTEVIKLDTNNDDEIDNIDKNFLVKDPNFKPKETNDPKIVITQDDEVSDNEKDDEDYLSDLESIVSSISTEVNPEAEFTKAQLNYIKNNEEHINSLKFNGKTLEDIVNEKNDTPITSRKIDIDSINKDLWENITYNNTESLYNLDNDIVKIFNFFGNIDKSTLILTDLSVEDTSTPQDYKYTWYANYRNMKNATRFNLKVDIPKLVDNKFMYLGGNNKVLGKQLFRIPISKSDISEVQLVSNYNKIFMYLNKSNLNNKISKKVYKLTKVLLNNDLANIKISKGDLTRANLKYPTDIERFDISSVIDSIKYKNYNISFNMEKLGNDYNNIVGYKGDEKIEIKKDSTPIDTIIDILSEDEQFKAEYESVKDPSNYIYSRIKILAEFFPVIFIVCYHVGLTKALNLTGIEYKIVDKKERNDKEYAYIKMKDYYIKYKYSLENSILLSGLVDCCISEYNYEELENKNTWIDILDNLNISRIKSDGLDSFVKLFIDPITEEVCEHYNFEKDYIKLLIEGSKLLSSTDYKDHYDMTQYRLRSNEQIAGYLYYALSSEYEKYQRNLKKTSKSSFFIKQNRVIELIMQDKMFTDTSDINDLHTGEMAQQASYKGLKGMNEERAYTLDKRSFDESMKGILTGSTGFSANVGMDRQLSLNSKIKSTRGYLDEVEKVEDSDLSLGDLSLTDSMIAFTTSSDDPFRQLMGYLQRNKHFVPTESSAPPLITTGTDAALPYLTANKFSINAKDDGIVEEVNDGYILISYNNGDKEFIDLTSQSIKDSANGIFLELRYSTNLKKNQKIKKDQILAYDSKSYSNETGGDLCYNFGALAKVALLNTNESYEDACKISQKLSLKLSSVIISIKDITLHKDSIIHYSAKVGDYVKEGEPLLVYQNPFSEEETNSLLNKLNIDGDDSFVNDLGKIVIKSKATGYIKEIKPYRTVEKEELSPTCLKYFNQFSKPYEEKLKIATKNKIKDKINQYGFINKQDVTGKLKNAYDSILLEYHVRTTNKFSTGDKLTLYTANKGVEHDFFPIGLEPTSSYRENEIIDTFGSLSAINKRKVTSVLKVALLNKGIIELTRQVKDILNIPYDVNTDL